MSQSNIDYDKKLPAWLYRNTVKLDQQVMLQIRNQITEKYNNFSVKFHTSKPNESTVFLLYIQIKPMGPFCKGEYRIHPLEDHDKMIKLTNLIKFYLTFEKKS